MADQVRRHKLVVEVYDADPGYADVDAIAEEKIEYDDDEDEVALARDVIEVCAAGLSAEDGYSVGDRLYAILRYSDETIGKITYALTAEDIGL